MKLNSTSKSGLKFFVSRGISRSQFNLKKVYETPTHWGWGGGNEHSPAYFSQWLNLHYTTDAVGNW